MSQKESVKTSTYFCWPLSRSFLLQNRHVPPSKPLHLERGHHEKESSDKSSVDVSKNGTDAIPKFCLPFKSKSHRHGVSSQVPRLSTVHEASYERPALSLDPDQRLARNEEARYCEYGAPSSEMHLRGGGSQRQAGKLEWLKTTRSLNKTLGKGKRETSPPVVTYKGRKIGSPQPAPALNVLPLASRFAREPETRATSITARRTPLNNNDDVLANDLPIPLGHDDRVVTYVESPPLPPPPALLATPSRPATSNPFAGIYGNPYAVRTNPTSPPIDYDLAGSLVGRPSALDGFRTGYDFAPELPGMSPLRHPDKVPSDFSDPHGPTANLNAQKLRADRKWDALPPLPPGEGAPEPPSRDHDQVEADGSDYEPFDTEEVLSSLRPERLSLYHIGLPERPTNGSPNAEFTSTAITEWPAVNDSRKAVDSHSVRTRDWDVHSCDTDDLGIDNRLRRREQLATRSAQRPLPEERQSQANIYNNNEALYGLPEEDAPTAESLFYVDMIEIINDYHEQLQEVIRRAYEAGEISEEHWLREKWRHRIAMDRKLRAAEDMSGYKILTNEADIKEAIEQPTGYAIYSSLLKIRDPETWQRIFEPALTHPRSGPNMTTPQQRAAVPENSLMWLARKIGRGLRFILAVPDNPDLKTYSNRHPPAPIPNIQSALSKSFAPTSEQPRPSTQTERAPKLSNDTTRVNNNTMFTGATLASPLNGRIVMAPRNRGYEQGAFVTIVTPSVVSNKSEKTTAGYGAGRPGNTQRVKDDVSEITAWPEAKC